MTYRYTDDNFTICLLTASLVPGRNPVHLTTRRKWFSPGVVNENKNVGCSSSMLLSSITPKKTKLAYNRCFTPLKIVKVIVIIAKAKLDLCLV